MGSGCVFAMQVKGAVRVEALANEAWFGSHDGKLRSVRLSSPSGEVLLFALEAGPFKLTRLFCAPQESPPPPHTHNPTFPPPTLHLPLSLGSSQGDARTQGKVDERWTSKGAVFGGVAFWRRGGGAMEVGTETRKPCSEGDGLASGVDWPTSGLEGGAGEKEGGGGGQERVLACSTSGVVVSLCRGGAGGGDGGGERGSQVMDQEGEVEWRVDLPKPVFAAPCFDAAGGGYVGCADGALYKFSPSGQMVAIPKPET